MSAVIELDGLSVRFGTRPILKGLQATLRGRSIGLLGPNGAGKTTLLHTLLGFHPPHAGTARVFGKDILTHGREVRALLGYMPENPSFIAGMSAVRMVRLMAELSGLPPRAALERAHEALYYVGLGEARYRKLETYSLGMQQMAKLAQAIVHGPQLVFLDEPTNGLDPAHRERMIRMIQEIRDSGRAHLILSSHLLRDVEQCCDEVLILKDGEVAVTCNLEEERRANRKFIEVETLADPAVLAEEVGKLGCEWALVGKRKLKMVLPEGVEVRDLFKIAAARELQIRRLDFKRDSLQDIFLKAMEAGRGSV
ncbi:MAG TPA: ABC transporter ATP-binding protein [Candidatus Polarisedimenticolaceae bacterium]|nr:ABC transporter ATP-binding protein [Candidatus Polarisedimenticolaceae bacterium]